MSKNCHCNNYSKNKLPPDEIFDLDSHTDYVRTELTNYWNEI